MIAEASRALARLDADRLEELALSCQALNRDAAGGDLDQRDGDGRAALAEEAREAAGDLAVFARVLEATRANLEVMNRLREMHTGRLEYRAGRLEYRPQAPGWRQAESGHGDN
jgi:hypothetical protein